MTPLVEVHDESEVDRARSTPAPGSMGVNARDLRTLRGRPRRRSRGSRRGIPDGVVKVAESGVRGPHDLHRLRRGRAPTRCSSGRRWSPAGPRAGRRRLVTAGAHPALQRLTGGALTAAPSRRQRRPTAAPG